MRFVRAAVNRDSGKIIAIAVSDCPLSDKLAVDELAADGVTVYRCEMVDLGMVDEHQWTDLAGNATTPDRHIYERLTAANVQASDVAATPELAAIAGLTAIHAAPCTPNGIRAHIRAGKPLKGKARAWIACTLPEHEAQALGILSGVPVSVQKAVAAIRARRDPSLGWDPTPLERQAQAQSDARAARHLQRRKMRATAATKPEE